MSIADFDKVDGMGVLKSDDRVLVLMITDHLPWDDAEAHIWALEDKINAYVEFIETKQYQNTYPDRSFDKFIIQIYFMYPYPETCTQFLKTATKQFAPLNITFRAAVEA